MATVTELNQHFAPAGSQLEADVLAELQTILRLHSISPQELFYKWESYSIKMGGEALHMQLKSARDLKRDLQDTLERETRGKLASRHDKRLVSAMPRAAKTGGGAFGMLEGVVQSTPQQSTTGVNGISSKRKHDFDSPLPKASKAHAGSSPNQMTTPASNTGLPAVPFAQRHNIGEILESLHPEIDWPEYQTEATLEPRIALRANTDIKKFAYKNMAMKLSEASEVLDDRIDEFLGLVQDHYQLDDGTFGNPAAQSPSEVVAVGRIASDCVGEKLNVANIVLETSRRTGAGLRVPLKFDGVPRFELFSGKIVAVRGKNVTGEAFVVTEVLPLPKLGSAAASIAELDAIHTRLLGRSAFEPSPARPLNVMACAGPYTADSNLAFEPLHALCDRAAKTRADALIMIGPFLDIDHPLVAAGDFSSLPTAAKTDPDQATLNDVFRGLVSEPLQRLVQEQPGITIIMVPSTRDAVSKHSSWPQDKLPRKELGLPKQCVMVPNPVMLCLNEIIVGLSSQDILFELRPQECVGGTMPAQSRDLLARLSGHLIEQRHFFPLYPPSGREWLPRPTTGEEEVAKATGATLDIGYLMLGDWPKVKPDMLIIPSALNPFAKVVDSVVVVNPGTLSKKKAPGTFSQLCINEREVSTIERSGGELVDHQVFDRTRVDVVRI